MKGSAKVSGNLTIARTIEEVEDWRQSLALDPVNDRQVVGFVPTMGALHRGHEKLIQTARAQTDCVAVSIFVNPTQFAPGEDLDKYPRTFEKDLALCKKLGVSLVFCPEPSEIYGSDYMDSTFVEPPPTLVDKLCGSHRPGHFRGVATVVTKLFNIVRPEIAYFGEKDYQQLLVVKRLVCDLNIPVRVVGVPTVREKDGLALSSRNAYLSNEERAIAPQLYKGLVKIRDLVLEGSNQSCDLVQAIAQVEAELKQKHGFQVEYLKACSIENLAFLDKANQPFVLLVAVRLGNVRLIDNLLVENICRLGLERE